MPLTLDQCHQIRDERGEIWMIAILPFVGSPLDNGRRSGCVELFYDCADKARQAFADTCASGHASDCELVVWRYAEGCYARSTIETWEHPPALPAARFGDLHWWGPEPWGPDAGSYSCTDHALTVAEVRHAAEGEAEGGLGALARLYLGTRGESLPPPSPAGWYWTAAVRGVWTRPTLAASAEEAMAAASAYLHAAEVARVAS